MPSILKFDQWQTTAGVVRNTVLQVRSFTKTDAYVASGNFNDPGLDVTITPTSSTSRILVMITLCMSTNATTMGFILRRNGTNISAATGDAVGSASRMSVISSVANNVWQDQMSFTFLDSPGTTSACTYDVVLGSHDGREYRLNRSGSGSPGANLDDSRSASTITVMEIAA